LIGSVGLYSTDKALENPVALHCGGVLSFAAWQPIFGRNKIERWPRITGGDAGGLAVV